MTKIEMLDKLSSIREAVAALPDGAEPIAVYCSYISDYIHVSSYGEKPEAKIVVNVDGDDGQRKEYHAEVLGVPVIWLES